MADLKQCDKCKIISPDKEDLHISNHWIAVKYSHGIKDRGAGRISRNWHEAEFCEECFKEITDFIEES